MEQHAVPKFYLRRFTPRAGQRILWQYTKATCTVTRISPSKATAESHLYSVKLPNGTWDESLEHQLAELESAAADPIRRLSIGAQLGGSDREAISNLMGAMFLRVEGPRRAAEDQGKKLATVSGALPFLDSESAVARALPPPLLAAYKAHLVVTNRGITLPPQAYLVNFLPRVKRLGAKLAKMTWTVFKCSRQEFYFTSDNPVFARRPGHLLDPGIVGIGRADLGVELGFPLSLNSFLVASWGKLPEGLQQADSKKVAELNARTVVSSYSYVFGPFKTAEAESLVRQFADFRLAYPKVIE